ncbi:MAG: tryptophan-rich sensory protein [Candidatus Bathyarchaeota archaeon]|nr:tryptophan-rich sensory protein [Candidatus Bathyarchaeum sp.]
MKIGAYYTIMLNRPVVFQAVNIVAYVVTLIVNGLAGSTTVLGGVTSADVSDMYPTLVTPAGFTFAIWGIIYTLLALFVIYQALPKNKDKPFLSQVSWFFGLSSLFNVVWLVLWHYDFVTYSVILMLGLLTSLILVYRRLDIGRTTADIKERLMVHLPFSVYLGWISIATIANVSVALTAIGWDGFGIEASTWAVLIIVVALLLSIAMIALRKDIAFCCVVIWALFGILSKQSDYENIVLISEIAIGILAVAIGATLVLLKFKR